VWVNGYQSYDEDGEPLTYQWSFISKPFGSSATLIYDSSIYTSAYFIADIQGTYILELILNDPYSQSLPDYVMISFENLKPVANAGSSRSILLGETVPLDGSASYDLNGDPLTYHWSVVSSPTGSGAQVFDPSASITQIIPDVEGTFSLQLIVNDGRINSDPSTIEVEVVAQETVITGDLQDLQDAINALDLSAFKNDNMQNTLINKINAIISQVNNREYADALAKLQNRYSSKNGWMCVNRSTGQQ